MTDCNMNDLDPSFRPLAQKFIDALNLAIAPCTAKIIVTWRSSADQDVAKANGLSNAAAGQSPHNLTDANGNPASKAIDFAIFTPNGVYVTNGKDPRYAQARPICARLGLTYGGDWLHPDYDHVEMMGWKSNKTSFS